MIQRKFSFGKVFQMRIETLAKRLAEKTNTPILEQVILDQADMRDLPMSCMPWMGAKLGTRPRMRTNRHTQKGLLVEHVSERPYGVISWQGNRISVSRLIFQLIQKPDYRFRMWNECETPLCVNPFHFRIEKIEEEEQQPEETFFIGEDEDIAEEEIEELVEILLTDYDPRSWQEVIEAEILEGIPHEPIRKMLIKMNKEHLT